MAGNIVPIGYDNFLPANKILAILDRKTNPIKSMISKAEMNNTLINATAGRKLKTVILTTDHYVVLCSLNPKTIKERYELYTDRETISVGSDNYLPKDNISSINPEKARPIKRMIQMARIQNKVVDATMGNATKAIIATSSGYIILSFLSPNSIAGRFSKNKLEINNNDNTL